MLGAVAQFQSFAAGFGAAGAMVSYAIVGQTGTEWEVGDGTFNGTTGLTRDRVRASSNSNALVNFSAGTKDVFATWSAEHMEHSTLGHALANSRGQHLP
jgi:hypothetical protein